MPERRRRSGGKHFLFRGTDMCTFIDSLPETQFFWGGSTYFTWKPLRATNSRRMSLVPSKIRNILRSLITLSTPASCRETTQEVHLEVKSPLEERLQSKWNKKAARCCSSCRETFPSLWIVKWCSFSISLPSFLPFRRATPNSNIS